MPMIRDTPAITHKIETQTRNSGNTILHKKFPGGHLTMAGANSPASLASRPIRLVLCDEVDRYPASAGDEGDPVSLATKRTATFWNRKRVLTSTPTVKGVSRIERAYESSDQRRYHVPCPHCGHYHPPPMGQRHLGQRSAPHGAYALPGMRARYSRIRQAEDAQARRMAGQRTVHRYRRVSLERTVLAVAQMV